MFALRKRGLTITIALFAAFALLLFGCGNGQTTQTNGTNNAVNQEQNKQNGGDAGSGDPVALENVQLRVGGSTTATWIYGFASTWAQVLKDKLPGVTLSVQATSGSSAHYSMIENGEIDIGTGFNPSEYYAARGEQIFEQPFTKFRAMMPVTDARGHIITLAKRDDIQTIHDLNGKNVGLGARGSPTTILAEVHAKALGIEANYVYSPAEQLMEMLADGRIDAVWYYAGAPWAAVLDLASQTEIKFLGMTEEELLKLQQAAPFTTIVRITSEEYDWVTEPVLAPGTLQTMIVSADVPEEVVYQLTKTTWENWDEIVNLVPAAGKVSAFDAVKLQGKLHPGAYKYYQELGMDIPDEIKP